MTRDSPTRTVRRMSDSANAQETVLVADVAKAAGCTRQAVDLAIKRGELKAAVEHPRLRLIAKADADAWVRLHRMRQGKPAKRSKKAAQ